MRGGYGVNYTGAPTFLQYSSIIGGAPGSSLSISRAPGVLTPSQYLDIASALTVFPLPTGGVAGILAYTIAFAAVIQLIELALLRPLERRANQWRR